MGIGMLITGVIAAILYFKNKLFECRPFFLWCMALTPSGFIAVLAGWFVTEVGRQPYTVYGLLRTADSVSPLVGSQVAVSLAAFVIVYGFVFGAGTYYILKLIGKGPSIIKDDEEFYDHSLEASVTKQLTKGTEG